MSLKLLESKKLQEMLVRQRAHVERLEEVNPTLEALPGDEPTPDRIERFYTQLRAVADHETRVPNQFDQLSDYDDPHTELEAMLGMVNEALHHGVSTIYWALDVKDDEKGDGATRFYFVGTEDAAIRLLELAFRRSA